jgi:hypothetical protein
MGGLQSRRVINSIAGDGNNLTVALERLDDAHLLIRRDPGENDFRVLQRLFKLALGKLSQLIPADDGRVA